MKEALMPYYRVANSIVNLRSTYYSLVNFTGFIRDYMRFRRNRGSDRSFGLEVFPVLGENVPSSPIDPHYFYVNAWAMRRIVANKPEKHYDFGSQVVLSSLLSSVIPSVYVDIRPLEVTLDGLSCEGGDLAKLNYESGSLRSVSCLHVIEHIGLGRYGDQFDPDGYLTATKELSRVLAKGGDIYIAVPTGIPKVFFNAHRVFSTEQTLKMFSGLRLVEISGVLDDGTYHENIERSKLDRCKYGCGFFHFKKD